jgi:hypothetical protein
MKPTSARKQRVLKINKKVKKMENDNDVDVDRTKKYGAGNRKDYYKGTRRKNK